MGRVLSVADIHFVDFLIGEKRMTGRICVFCCGCMICLLLDVVGFRCTFYQVLREAVVMGMPRTRRAWKKILVVVEGIYSMEGEVADLKPIVEVAKRHKVWS